MKYIVTKFETFKVNDCTELCEKLMLKIFSTDFHSCRKLIETNMEYAGTEEDALILQKLLALFSELEHLESQYDSNRLTLPEYQEQLHSSLNSLLYFIGNIQSESNIKKLSDIVTLGPYFNHIFKTVDVFSLLSWFSYYYPSFRERNMQIPEFEQFLQSKAREHLHSDLILSLLSNNFDRYFELLISHEHTLIRFLYTYILHLDHDFNSIYPSENPEDSGVFHVLLREIYNQPQFDESSAFRHLSTYSMNTMAYILLNTSTNTNENVLSLVSKLQGSVQLPFFEFILSRESLFDATTDYFHNGHWFQNPQERDYYLTNKLRLCNVANYDIQKTFELIDSVDCNNFQSTKRAVVESMVARYLDLLGAQFTRHNCELVMWNVGVNVDLPHSKVHLEELKQSCNKTFMATLHDPQNDIAQLLYLFVSESYWTVSGQYEYKVMFLLQHMLRNSNEDEFKEAVRLLLHTIYLKEWAAYTRLEQQFRLHVLTMVMSVLLPNLAHYIQDLRYDVDLNPLAINYMLFEIGRMKRQNAIDMNLFRHYSTMIAGYSRGLDLDTKDNTTC